jgi:preprotein translocase subunit SecG
MYTFLSILYVFVCLFLILVVLLQSGKGGGLGSAFGGSSTQIFGGAGAGNLLTRLTAVSAFLFMTLSVALAFYSTSGEQALDRAIREQAAAQEAAPELDVEEAEAAALEAEQAAAAEAEAEVEVEADVAAAEAEAVAEEAAEAGEAPADAPAEAPSQTE